MAGSIGIKEIKRIEKIHPAYRAIKNFVETGTYQGSTVIPLSKQFEHIYTIELMEKWHRYAMARAAKEKASNIRFYLGDSKDVLPRIVKEAKGPTIFFLDGHCCGEHTDTAKTDEKPLLFELEAINKGRRENDIIIIDDLRMFHGHKTRYPKGSYWSRMTIENVIGCLDRARIRKYCARNDRFIIYLRPDPQRSACQQFTDSWKPSWIRFTNRAYLRVVKLVPMSIRKWCGKRAA